MYHVEKITNRTFTDDISEFWYTGIAWGVFDNDGELSIRANPHGDPVYDVYDYKYVAQHQADYLNKEL